MARTKQASTRSIGKPSESRNSSPECHICRLTSRRSQPPLALAVPLSRFTPRVGGGSAFYVRRHYTLMKNPREISTAPKPEQEAWLLDSRRTPREILDFTKLRSAHTDIQAIADLALHVRLSEIAESSTRCIIRLTVALLVLTAVLLIFTAYLYKDTHA